MREVKARSSCGKHFDALDAVRRQLAFVLAKMLITLNDRQSMRVIALVSTVDFRIVPDPPTTTSGNRHLTRFRMTSAFLVPFCARRGYAHVSCRYRFYFHGCCLSLLLSGCRRLESTSSGVL